MKELIWLGDILTFDFWARVADRYLKFKTVDKLRPDFATCVHSPLTPGAKLSPRRKHTLLIRITEVQTEDFQGVNFTPRAQRLG
jgi:hypothetical protein